MYSKTIGNNIANIIGTLLLLLGMAPEIDVDVLGQNIDTVLVATGLVINGATWVYAHVLRFQKGDLATWWGKKKAKK